MSIARIVDLGETADLAYQLRDAGTGLQVHHFPRYARLVCDAASELELLMAVVVAAREENRRLSLEVARLKEGLDAFRGGASREARDEGRRE